jgi:hypothetical protein
MCIFDVGNIEGLGEHLHLAAVMFPCALQFTYSMNMYMDRRSWWVYTTTYNPVYGRWLPQILRRLVNFWGDIHRNLCLYSQNMTIVIRMENNAPARRLFRRYHNRKSDAVQINQSKSSRLIQLMVTVSPSRIVSRKETSTASSSIQLRLCTPCPSRSQ